MKKFTLLLSLVLVAALCFGQTMQKQNAKKSSDNTFQKDSKSAETKEVILLETFDTWPPTDWEIVDGPDCQGLQHWYDGTGYAAISWDDDGDGTARPQDEWMITPEVLVPATNGKFSFYFHSNPYWMVSPNNNADLLVKITVDNGTTWTELWNEDDYTWEYDTWTEVILPLDTYAGQNAKFAIQYVGTDACWVYIDNVSVFVPEEYDVSLEDSRVNFWPYYSDYGYSGHFGQIPIDQITETGAPVYFEGILKNKGMTSITPELTISVLDPSETEVFTQTVPAQSEIAFNTADSAFVEDPYYVFDPAELGTYTFNFTASIPGQTDADETNNTISFESTVTNNIYAHDSDNLTGDFSTCDYDGDYADGDIVGVIYQFFATTPINEMSFYIPNTTEVGTAYRAMLMYEDGEVWTELVSTAVISIDDETQTDVWHNVTFLNDYTVEVAEGEMVEVLAAVEYQLEGGTKKFFLGSDGMVTTMGFETKIYFAAEDKWYYYGGSQVPMIRLNVGEEVEESVSSFETSNISMYPNPSTGVVTISNVEGATIEVMNLMGQVVATVENAQDINNLDLSKEANGTYIVRIVNGSEISTSKLNLQK